MKKYLFSLMVLVCLSMNAWAENFKSEEEHSSPEACRQAIAQYAKDRETAAKYKGEYIKVTWKSSDTVKLEFADYSEELRCAGNTSHHWIISN